MRRRGNGPAVQPRPGLGKGLIGFIDSTENNETLYKRGIRDGQLIPIMRSSTAKRLLGSSQNAIMYEYFSLLSLGTSSVDAIRAMVVMADDFDGTLGNREFRYMSPDEQRTALLNTFETKLPILDDEMFTPRVLYTQSFNIAKQLFNTIRDQVGRYEPNLKDADADLSPLHKVDAFGTNCVVRLTPPDRTAIRKDQAKQKISELEADIAKIQADVDAKEESQVSIQNELDLAKANGVDSKAKRNELRLVKLELNKAKRLHKNKTKELSVEQKKLKDQSKWFDYPVVDVFETTEAKAIELWYLAKNHVVDPVLCIVPKDKTVLKVEVSSTTTSSVYVCMCSMSKADTFDFKVDDCKASLERLLGLMSQYCNTYSVDDINKEIFSYNGPAERGSYTGVCRLNALGAKRAIQSCSPDVKHLEWHTNRRPYTSITGITVGLVDRLELDNGEKQWDFTTTETDNVSLEKAGESAPQSSALSGSEAQPASLNETKSVRFKVPDAKPSPPKSLEKQTHDLCDELFATFERETSKKPKKRIAPTKKARGENGGNLILEDAILNKNKKKRIENPYNENLQLDDDERKHIAEYGESDLEDDYNVSEEDSTDDFEGFFDDDLLSSAQRQESEKIFNELDKLGDAPFEKNRQGLEEQRSGRKNNESADNDMFENLLAKYAPSASTTTPQAGGPSSKGEYELDSAPVVLMLTVDAPTQELFWRTWVPEHAKILVNSKNWRPEINDPAFKLIDGNVTDTAWGTASLVQAHEALLKEGTRMFPNASHYVLVSGDSAPVKTYQHFVGEMQKHLGETLLSDMSDDFNVSVLELLAVARDRGIDLGWWSNILDHNLEVPLAWQWSAISNEAARYLTSEGMTEKAVIYERICRTLGVWEKMVSADEVVPHAILMKHKPTFAIKLKDMSPVWCSLDQSGKHASWHAYNEVLSYTDQRSNYIFARKILPFGNGNQKDVLLIKERMGLDIPLPEYTAEDLQEVIELLKGAPKRTKYTIPDSRSQFSDCIKFFNVPDPQKTLLSFERVMALLETIQPDGCYQIGYVATGLEADAVEACMIHDYPDENWEIEQVTIQVIEIQNDEDTKLFAKGDTSGICVCYVISIPEFEKWFPVFYKGNRWFGENILRYWFDDVPEGEPQEIFADLVGIFPSQAKQLPGHFAFDEKRIQGIFLKISTGQWKVLVSTDILREPCVDVQLRSPLNNFVLVDNNGDGGSCLHALSYFKLEITEQTKVLKSRKLDGGEQLYKRLIKIYRNDNTSFPKTYKEFKQHWLGNCWADPMIYLQKLGLNQDHFVTLSLQNDDVLTKIESENSIKWKDIYEQFIKSNFEITPYGEEDAGEQKDEDSPPKVSDLEKWLTENKNTVEEMKKGVETRKKSNAKKTPTFQFEHTQWVTDLYGDVKNVQEKFSTVFDDLQTTTAQYAYDLDSYLHAFYYIFHREDASIVKSPLSSS